MQRIRLTILFSIACFLSAEVFMDPNSYRPDILTFDGEQSYVFKSDNRLSIWDGGTIEFWVASDWSELPVYNPVILSNSGTEGILYEIAIRADKKGLTIQSGGFVGEIEFDFDDSEMHHVGLVNFGDLVIAMIDGKLVGSTALKFEDLPSSELHLGASRNGAAPFHGAIAGLRIWDKTLEAETLVEFSWADSTSDSSTHPDLNFLAGHSDFSAKDFYIIDRPIIPSGIVDIQKQ